MPAFFKIILPLPATMCILLLLASCASYHQRIEAYHSSLAHGNFTKANTQIENIKLLKKNRNRLLYLLEKGKTFHLLQEYDSSNRYFNEADLLMEDSRITPKDLLVTDLLNPMYRHYQPEDFERFMVHYYKALNYLFKGDTEAAMVEARRISLETYRQDEKFNGNENRYSNDAFSLMLQGIIYEKGSDMNNAFIAYRNAADVYIANNNTWYGTEMPMQLKKDLLRTAAIIGFTAEQERYERIFDLVYKKEEASAGGEAIIFWESGMAPVKEEQVFEFNIFNNDDRYFFRDRGGLYDIHFDNTAPGYHENLKPGDLQMFAIALPRYSPLPPQFLQASLSTGAGIFSFEKTEDINTLAVQTLKQRLGRELATALSRMAIKKLTEAAAAPKDNKDEKYRTEEERKKAERRRDQQELLAMGLKIFNRATEKADTRNWQSLPGSIFYSRIPLQAGINHCTVTLQNNAGQTDTKLFELDGTGIMQFKTIYSMR
jgi:uncharacterized protein